MNTSPSEIMTIEDVAEFLRLPLSSAYKLAHAGKIPGQKVGRHWRFFRPALEKWISGEQQKSMDVSNEHHERGITND